jgi:hypothetical protein
VGTGGVLQRAALRLVHKIGMIGCRPGHHPHLPFGVVNALEQESRGWVYTRMFDEEAARLVEIEERVFFHIQSGLPPYES